jgi:hypothetical protein
MHYEFEDLLDEPAKPVQKPKAAEAQAPPLQPAEAVKTKREEPVKSKKQEAEPKEWVEMGKGEEEPEW